MKQQHGERRFYKAGCNCDECRAAHLAYVKGRIAKNIAEYSEEREDPQGSYRYSTHPNVKHGTTGGYTYYGCRCIDCTKAVRQVVNAYGKRVREAKKAEREGLD